MANRIRTGDPHGFNKGRSSKFREGSRVQQTLEEGRRTYRPKRCGNNNKDEDNCPKNLNDKNQQALSQKFWQLIILFNINHLFANSEGVTSIIFQHCSFICTQSNCSKYCNIITIFQFRHTLNEFKVFLFNGNNSIQHYSFIDMQLHSSKYYYCCKWLTYDQNNGLTQREY